VVDTATYFTFRGAGVPAADPARRAGDLTFTSLVIVALGGRLSLRQEALSVGSPMDIGYHKIDPRRLVVDVALFTFIFEAVGAVVLYVLWVPRFGWEEAAWPAVFHSISAFCNAGFSTFSDSLVRLPVRPG
jgi:trk system potassium uptake protein